MWTRREFGKLALGTVPAAALLGKSAISSILSAAERPNSLINGVQVGTITYSYRSMPDQSAEATLKYIVDSGVSAIELMGGPVESFAGAPPSGRGGGAGAPGGPGGSRGAAGRGRGGERGADAPIPEGARKGSWNGQECVIPAPPGAAAEPGAAGGRGGGRGE